MKIRERLRGTCIPAALAVLVAACGGEAPDGAAPSAGAAGADAPPVAPSAAGSGAFVPENGVPPEAPAPQIPAQGAPTRDDSVAGARDDVSPEWKQRARGMETRERCLLKAQAAEPPLRERLQEACSRLPDAPS